MPWLRGDARPQREGDRGQRFGIFEARASSQRDQILERHPDDVTGYITIEADPSGDPNVQQVQRPHLGYGAKERQVAHAAPESLLEKMAAGSVALSLSYRYAEAAWCPAKRDPPAFDGQQRGGPT